MVDRRRMVMKIETNVKAGAMSLNYNLTMVRGNERPMDLIFEPEIIEPGAAPHSDIDLSSIFYDRRREARVKLKVALYLSRPMNSSSYRHEVRTRDVSLSGACVISDVKLEVGAIIEVYGFEDRFAAVALVQHVKQRFQGGWRIGLKFINKTGSWVVIG
jgi:hypothetical protein